MGMNSVFSYREIAKELHGKSWHEVFRVPSMSVGLYRLRTGEEDLQSPHTEDEVYYVVQGKAQIRVGEKNFAVEPGSLIYVEANLEHRFHTITEDLTVLVLFSPAEYTNR